MRLIDANALKETLDYYINEAGWSEDVNMALSWVKDDFIDAEPIVYVEHAKHGKWEMKPDPYGFFDEIPVCSCCGCAPKYREKTSFCPYCGADMRDEDYD